MLEPVPGGMIYGLLRDLGMATKIAQIAKHCKLGIHNFDKADSLISHLAQQKPAVIILDWDACEADAYKVLKEIRQNADYKSVVSIGYVSGVKMQLREEAQRAGCMRVYHKTEFVTELPTLIARYSK